MNEIHDTCYAVLTDAPALVKELEKYMKHIEQCMEEDGLTFDAMADLDSQLEAAKIVRENIRRVFDE